MHKFIVFAVRKSNQVRWAETQLQSCETILQFPRGLGKCIGEMVGILIKANRVPCSDAHYSYALLFIISCLLVSLIFIVIKIHFAYRKWCHLNCGLADSQTSPTQFFNPNLFPLELTQQNQQRRISSNTNQTDHRNNLSSHKENQQHPIHKREKRKCPTFPEVLNFFLPPSFSSIKNCLFPLLLLKRLASMINAPNTANKAPME